MSDTGRRASEASREEPRDENPSEEARSEAAEPGAAAEPAPEWAVVANVVTERPYGPGGQEIRRGLRLFRPGAKVYVIDGFGGMGWETVTVVGQGRGSRGFITVHVRTEHLTDWRVKLVYSPAALRRIGKLRSDSHAGFWLRSPEGYGDFGSERYRDALAEVADSFRRRGNVNSAGTARTENAAGTVPAANAVPPGEWWRRIRALFRRR